MVMVCNNDVFDHSKGVRIAVPLFIEQECSNVDAFLLCFIFAWSLLKENQYFVASKVKLPIVLVQ